MLRHAMLDENNIVVNIIIADESFGVSIGAVLCGNIPVNVGDTYANGYFYRNGEQLYPEKTEVEKLREQLEATQAAVDFLLMNAQIA